MQRKNLDQNQITTSLEKIVHEQNRLNELVEKILFVSSIEEMTNDMQQKPVDLHNIINQIIANDTNTHIIKNNIPKKVIIIGDDFYLISLFQNLLDNAKKYSPKGSTINFYIENHIS